MLKKILGGILVAALAAGNCTFTALAADTGAIQGSTDSVSGWTGKAGGEGYDISGLQLQTTKANNGKFSDGEDSIVYSGLTSSADEDFIFKATMNIEELNTAEGASNPQQASAGIAVLDELYNKTDDKAYTNAVFGGAYAAKSSDDMAIYALARDGSDKKAVYDKLSDSFSNSGSDLGLYELSIAKSGNTYTVSCGENSQTIEINSFSGDIYPCVYVARNAKVTFSDVSYTKTPKLLSLELKGAPKTDYVYGEEIDLGEATLEGTFEDGVRTVDDYIVKGYSPNRIGKQPVRLVKGGIETGFDVNVSKLNVKSVKVNYAPVRTKYVTGEVFESDGLEALITYQNGTSEVVGSDALRLVQGGAELKDGSIIKSTENTVKVYRKDTVGISGGGAYGEFDLDIEKAKVSTIEITKLPFKTKYYLGDTFDPVGMEVKGEFYKDGELIYSGTLQNNAYTVRVEGGSKITAAGTKKVTVTSLAEPSVSAQFEIECAEKQKSGISLAVYPRTTYYVGEEFSPEGMQVDLLYDNGEIVKTEDDSLDLSGFNTSTPGECSISIVPSETSLEAITVPVTVTEKPDVKWRSAVFGQSTSGYTGKPETDPIGVLAENYGTSEGVINVKAWEGNGKITADHDGIAYYYTTVGSDKDFELSADVEIVKYLEHDNDDAKRNGQEAFGIMAKDAIPLSGETDSEGVAIPLCESKVFASNMVIAGGYSGSNYSEEKANLNRINLVGRTGVEESDGGGTKIGPNPISSSFPKEGSNYRITLRRVNGGVYASAKDIASGETMDSFISDAGLLTTQDADNIYVGFFAARWAEINVSNVDFHITSPTTDMSVESEDLAEDVGDISIRSDEYVTSPDYMLHLDSTVKGKVSVSLNNKQILVDEDIDGEKLAEVKLNGESENYFTVKFTPSPEIGSKYHDSLILRKRVVCRSFDVNADNVYVSPEGSYLGEGTKEKPYDVDTAVGFLQPGQTAILLEGTYLRENTLTVPYGNNGSEGLTKTVKADEGAKVVFDLQNKCGGAEVSGNYWNFDGIEFKNSGENIKCFHLGGNNCIISNCIFHDNGDIGLQLSRTFGLPDKSNWPSYNLILNCEAYNNCDPSMINADGFGAKLTVGEGNVFENCTSHNNVDDGWDLYTKVNSGPIGVVTLKNCKSYRNGYKLLEDGTEEPYPSGGWNGFKMGGENVGVKHRLINCEAYENGNNGITTNSNPSIYIENVSSHNNKACNYRLYSDKPDEYDISVISSVSSNPGEPDVIGTQNYHTEYTNHSADGISISNK